jgi:hypothetical protein
MCTQVLKAGLDYLHIVPQVKDLCELVVVNIEEMKENQAIFE